MTDLLSSNTNLIAAIAVLVLVTFSFIAGWLSHSKSLGGTWAQSWLQGFSTEMAGAIVTAVVLTLVFNNIQSIEAKRENSLREREDLVLRVASQRNEISSEAIRQLRQLGWLKSDMNTLSNRYFENANLIGVDLSNSQLYGAIFINAMLEHIDFRASDLTAVKLDGANINDADFTDAILSNIDFRKAKNVREAIWIRANLRDANFYGLNLNGVDFSGTNLDGTDFRSANLAGAILDGANLANAIFDENSIMPNGKQYKGDMDLSVFTT